MKYYIHKDGDQKGPYTIEELKEIGISRSTMVWYEGMGKWKKAGKVGELKPLLNSVPPELNSNSLINKSKAIKLLFFSILLFIIAIGVTQINFGSGEEANLDSKKDSIENAFEKEAEEKAKKEALYQSFTGEYLAVSYQNTRAAQIKYLGNNELKFNIGTTTKRGCTGQLSGNLIINEDGYITYKRKSCRLNFTFEGKKLKIDEPNSCDHYHGMNCFFSANLRKYTRREMQVKEKYFKNLDSYLNPHPNNYKKNLLTGGVWDLEIKIDNKTLYTMDKVHVKVTYLKADKSIYQTREVIFSNIKPGGRAITGAPNSEKGVEVKCEIVHVESKSLYS